MQCPGRVMEQKKDIKEKLRESENVWTSVNNNVQYWFISHDKYAIQI